ncbi:hypothetical protein Acr_11g0004350 [Actinidia rufa]|uniref:Uncharacterized protein n=1 Tax=Actinidia rufa TaxID=165716 RepID=A0A7J0FD01_9ERIC|nr:hypothetical protein Acr_11g0004350 [Actinidia rufa]
MYVLGSSCDLGENFPNLSVAYPRVACPSPAIRSPSLHEAYSLTESLKRISYARVCIEIEVDSKLPSSFDLQFADGEFCEVMISYPWKPSCRVFGHDEARYQNGNQDVQPQVQKQWVVKSKGGVEPEKLIREGSAMGAELYGEAVVLGMSSGSPLAPQGVQLSDSGICENVGTGLAFAVNIEMGDGNVHCQEGVSKGLTLSPGTLKGGMVIAPAATAIPVSAEGENQRIKKAAVTSRGRGHWIRKGEKAGCKNEMIKIGSRRPYKTGYEKS